MSSAEPDFPGSMPVLTALAQITCTCCRLPFFFFFFFEFFGFVAPAPSVSPPFIPVSVHKANNIFIGDTSPRPSHPPSAIGIHASPILYTAPSPTLQVKTVQDSLDCAELLPSH